MLKSLTVWITINCRKFWKRWEYQTTWPASWEICMQVRKQQLELDVEQQTGSKYKKEYIKAVYCHHASVHFSSVTQLSLTLWDPMNHSMPGLPVPHQIPELTQSHVHQVGNAIQPSHPVLSPSPPAANPFQHQSLFQWVKSLHELAKELEFQL